MRGNHRPKRHRWTKIRLHVYVCRECGTGRVNAQRQNGHWFTVFHLPDGRAIEDTTVPACERGPRTRAVLRKYESAIACAVGRSARELVAMERS